jgi:hypothetical protein
MNTVELIEYSLDNAIGILGQVTGDLSQDQADWLPPGIANPIGATYWHAASSVDSIVHVWCRGQQPLSDTAGWRDKVLAHSVPEPEHGGDWQTYMRSIRVDLPVLHEYSRVVGAAVKEWLASLTVEDLDRTLETPVGELSLGQVLTTFVIWHIDAHCGEIASLKGCQGAQGYPF